MIRKKIDKWIDEYVARREEKRQREMDEFEVEQFEGAESGASNFPITLRVYANDLEKIIETARLKKFRSDSTDDIEKMLDVIISTSESMRFHVKVYKKAWARELNRRLGLK